MNRSALLILCALWALPTFAAPTKQAGKTPPKSATPKPVATGALIEGQGLMHIKGTILSRGANTQAKVYESTNGERTFALSKATITQSNGMMTVVALTQTQLADEAPMRLQQGLTLAFASKGGFRVGQTIPVRIPVADKAGNFPTATAILSYTQHEIKQDPKQRQRASEPIRHLTRYSTWVGMRGTLKIESVAPRQVTFSLQNVVFERGTDPNKDNYAKGNFVFNGKGEATITEVDDGFH